MRALVVLAQETTSEDGISVPILVVAAVAGVAWLVVVALVAARRQPPAVPGVLSTQELPPEPPAVAGLLVDDFEIGAEAAPATLLDLAARRAVVLEEVEPGRTICRVPSRSGVGDLEKYEELVLRLVRDRAIDGIVPTEALTTGTQDASRGWQRDFQRAVVADSQSRGLTYDRWPRSVCTFLGLGIVLVGGLLSLAVWLGDGPIESDEIRVAVVAGTVVAASLAAIALVVARCLRSLAQLPTDAGMAAARRCAGLQLQLRDHEQLDTAAPASVVVWGRHLAYAAALGAARASVAALPMGEEDDHHAWSRFGGRWRRVRVRYPRAWPPAWGKHPGFAIFLAVVWGTLAGVAVRGLTVVATDASEPAGAGSPLTREALDWIGRTALILCVPAALVVAWALVVLVLAVPACWRRQHVTGELVRARTRAQFFSRDEADPWFYLAVDDGTRDLIPAWRVRGALYRSRVQGETVTAETSPGLGYVWSIDRASPDAPSTEG